MPVPRKRSCAQCRRAKTRCSLSSPNCSRCTSRSLQCDYSEALPSSGSLGLASNSWEGVVVREMARPGAGSGQLEPASGFDVAGHHASEIDLNFLGVDVTSTIQWDLEMEQFESRQVSRKSPFVFGGSDSAFEASDPFIQNLNDRSTASWIEYPFTPTIEVQETQSRRQSPSHVREDVPQETYLAELSRRLFMDFHAPPWPSPKTIPITMLNLLSRRLFERIGSNLTANFLFSTIQSYPEMLSTSNFPPFVHQYFSTMDSDLPEPLANCMVFMAMFRSKAPASEKFVYKTLFTEAQRLHNEFHAFDEWMKLAAIQALAIYIILVASEKDRCPTLCVILVLAVGEIAAVLHHWNVVSENEHKGNINWEEWRFIESKRRTMILLWLLEMLLDMNIGVPPSTSCRTLNEMPLPSSKGLWDASTKTEWEKNYKFYLSSRRSGGILKIGDLRAAQESDGEVIDESLVDDLHFWSSNADRFGGLIILAIR